MQFCCKTFRELLKPYISRNYWLDLGINLVLGRGADIMAGSRNFMFLPDYIRSILNETPAVAYERTLFEMPWSGVRKFNSTYLAPWILMAASLFLFYNMKFRKFIFTSFLGAFSGIGLVLLIISTISVNKTLSGNLNIWWTLPSLVVLLTRNERINRVFKLVYFIHIILNIFSGIFLVKGFSGTFLPWMITMAIMLLSDILQDENFTPGFTPWFLKNSTFIDQRLQIVSKH